MAGFLESSSLSEHECKQAEHIVQKALQMRARIAGEPAPTALRVTQNFGHPWLLCPNVEPTGILACSGRESTIAISQR